MRILLAVDGSEASEEAARQFSERPWPAASVVRVLSVVPSVYPAIPEATALPDFARIVQELTEGAEKHVQEVAESLRPSEFQVETRVRHGDPRLEVVEEAGEFGADIVVLGSNGRTGIQRWLLGSVAEYVVRHAPCSVEVARARAPASAKI